ncbi:MAG: hypothetical protein R3284_12075 [Rubricoccaceae bacterium]|nr:hypothetical protein [Rubricoccaceae bacterium]
MATRSQSRLVLYLIMLLGLVGGYLFNAQRDPAEAVPPQPQEVSTGDLNAFASLRVNYTALQSQVYQDLRIFGDVPVPTTAPGKSNPFQ